jgi:hypothetical protein
MRTAYLGLTVSLVLTACAGTTEEPKSASFKAPGSSTAPENPYPSTYVAYPGVPTVIKGATILDGEGGEG